MELHEAYTKKRDDAEQSIREMKKEIENILEEKTDKYKWLSYFKEFQNIDTLTRNVAVKLIHQVRVTDKKSIEVEFEFEDCYHTLLGAMQQTGASILYDDAGRLEVAWKEAV